MAKPIIMPQVGQDIETAVILEWHVNENDHVNKGDILFVVESDKAVFEIEADEPGVIVKILYNEGEEAKVFEPVAYIGEPGETIEDSKITDAGLVHKTVTTVSQEKQKTLKGDITTETRINASPSARRVARKHGVDLTGISGTGPNGRICKEDVLAAIASADSLSTHKSQQVTESKSPPCPDKDTSATEDTEIRFSKIRKTTAERLTQSKQTIPHFYLAVDVDMTSALAVRREYNQNAQTRITVNDIIIKTTASALSQFPMLNAHVNDDRLIVKKNITIGIAVSTDECVLIPVITDVDKKDIREVSLLSRDMISNAQQGIVKSQLQATFTITNLSMYMINYVLPIINPPECAILGAGKIEKRAVPTDRNRNIGIRDIMTLTLACDHRAVDGVYAAKFLKTLKRKLEKLAGDLT